MLETYKPRLEELGFRQALLADKETMSYNDAWGGTISFPEERWESWYRSWVEAPGSERYYRYLYDTDGQRFVGEIAYHRDGEKDIYICDVIVLAACWHRGFGSEGFRLLCEAAKGYGITVLYDDIAADNPSWKLVLKYGFEIDHQDREIVMVKKIL